MPPRVRPPSHPIPTDTRVFRQSSIGLALADSIDVLIQRGGLTAEVGNSLMRAFDAAMVERLSNSLTTSIQIKGNIGTYNHVDDIWNMAVSDPSVTVSPNGTYPNDPDVKEVLLDDNLKLTVHLAGPPLERKKGARKVWE